MVRKHQTRWNGMLPGAKDALVDAKEEIQELKEKAGSKPRADDEQFQFCRVPPIMGTGFYPTSMAGYASLYSSPLQP